MDAGAAQTYDLNKSKFETTKFDFARPILLHPFPNTRLLPKTISQKLTCVVTSNKHSTRWLQTVCGEMQCEEATGARMGQN